MVWLVGFLRPDEGTLATYWAPGAQKRLLRGPEEAFLQPGEGVRTPRTLPNLWASPEGGPELFQDPSPDPPQSPSNLQTRPIAPNRTVLSGAFIRTSTLFPTPCSLPQGP